MEEYRNSNNNLVLWLLIVLFASTTGIFAWLYNKELNNVKILTVLVGDTNEQKERLTDSFNTLLTEYKNIKTNNDTIKAKLSKEQKRIEELVKELKNTKNASAVQIAKYKKELGTLREIMKSFIAQIDSLNTINKNLTEENTMVKTEYQKARVTNKELEDKNQSLKDIVNIASVIKLRGLTALPINAKAKEMFKIDKIDKIKISFTLEKNDVAKVGTRDVYVRIARPDELVLTPTEEEFFTYQGAKVVYSTKRQVEYNRADTDMTIYWKKTTELIPGKYVIDVFIDGNMIGTTNLILK